MRPRVLAEAEAELLAAMLYYEDRQEGLGEDFYERVSNAMAAIARDPLRHPVYERMFDARFPPCPSRTISVHRRLRGAGRGNARNRCGTLGSAARLLGRPRRLALACTGNSGSAHLANGLQCRSGRAGDDSHGRRGY